MYKLGEPYTWETWQHVPVGTKCNNREFPGAVLIVAMRSERKVLIWKDEGLTPVSAQGRSNTAYMDNPFDGFEPAASWTRPLLYHTICLPTGA